MFEKPEIQGYRTGQLERKGNGYQAVASRMSHRVEAYLIKAT